MTLNETPKSWWKTKAKHTGMIKAFIAYIVVVISFFTFIYINSSRQLVEYEKKVEEKHDIELLEVENFSGTVSRITYRNSEGDLCVAEITDTYILIGERCGG